ncbi:MAG: sensory box protein [Sphingomonadales bacterium]|nr:sensory box protein [Sphingomonadales bacterium]
MVITDPRQSDHPIVFANEAFQRLTGYDRFEILGRNCRFLQGPKTDPHSVREIRKAVDAERPINIDLLNYRKDGTPFWNALFVRPVRAENGVVQFFFASQFDVSERVEAQRQITEQKHMIEEIVKERTAALEAALEIKTTLLHEVDHRVKNNLTLMGSLLRLQSRSIPDPRLRRTLENMLERIDALSTVHRRLYESDDINQFDVGTFAHDLASDILGAAGRSDIRLRIAVEPIYIPTGKATAVGLVLNELITNAVKHAYPEGRGGELALTVFAVDGYALIKLQDDGPGFDPVAPSRDSIGRALIERLSRQIHAETCWDVTPNGTGVSVKFPIYQ